MFFNFETRTGFEPVHVGFANRSATTSPPGQCGTDYFTICFLLFKIDLSKKAGRIVINDVRNFAIENSEEAALVYHTEKLFRELYESKHLDSPLASHTPVSRQGTKKKSVENDQTRKHFICLSD